ncbi:MAG: hypothetical protein ACI9Y1_003311 [Lentisphaeria bacterium]|jgi:hypothetical protein
MSSHYFEEHEEEVTDFYDSLSEKDRRRYAAVEAKKIGYGGTAYICSLFGCDDKTVKNACWIFMMKKHFSRRVS